MKSTLRDKPDCPTPTRRLPFLVVDDGREKGKIISIGRASLTLGRDKNSGIRVEARGVSRRHARFHIRKGTVKLEDLGSTNGTWRNGKRVKRATLKDGDQLQFGACIATFRQDHLTAPSKRGNYYVITGGGDDMSAVKVKIVQIGNSRGIRIPKALLEQCGLEGELELVPDGDQLILRPSARPRKGWAKAFKEMAERGDDALLTGDIQSDFDDNEWEWQ
jgi:antitoxin MazE